MCIIALEPISMAYLINPSRQSVCMSIPLILVRQLFGKSVAPERIVVGGVGFYVVRVLSK
jgi:hypothetical protein